MAPLERSPGVNEARRMAQPAIDFLGAMVRRAHWPIGVLFAAYLVSGVTAVKADEVAIVMRFGRIVGDSPGDRIHGPGLLWALPRPIDEVVRVQVEKVHEVEITDLWGVETLDTAGAAAGRTMSPVEGGYCLTGDRNILQLSLLARYRVQDPVAFVLQQHAPHTLLKDAVQTEVVRAAGRQPIDDVMSEERNLLGQTVRNAAQARLDMVGSGLELIAVEIVDFGVPAAVNPAFLEVSTAFIEARQIVLEALRYRAGELPKAESERDQMLASAKIYAADLLADARGDATAFEALAFEYQRSPRVILERLFFEGIERVFANAGQRRFVQPPVGQRYEDFRITISPPR